MQLLYVVGAIGTALALPQISIWFTVSSSKAIESLLAVGVAMVTFLGIVYSLLFLVVQFASTSFTPRLNLFRDAPIVWHAFGFYTGVIVFSFTAAFSIGRGEQTSGLVPIALMLALIVTIALFRVLQTTALRSVQLAATLAQIRSRGREVIAEVYPAALGAQEAETTVPGDAAREETCGVSHDVVWHGDSAVLQVIDARRLALVAGHAGVVVELPLAPGETVDDGSVLAIVRGGAGSSLDKQILKALTLGLERTFEQDPRFALRVLADIALRALSPAVNDPSTTVQALDSMNSLLRALVVRDLGVGRVADSGGVTRVVFVLPAWDEYVGLALDEVISTGLSSITVRARVERLLVELLVVTPPARRDPLNVRLRQLHGGRA